MESQSLMVDKTQAHHVEFENKEGFRQCIDALYDYYAEFVVPWHIVELTKVFG